jgi:hypothetical protein
MLDKVIYTGILKSYGIKHTCSCLSDTYAFVTYTGLDRKTLGRKAAEDRKIIILGKLMTEVACTGSKYDRALKLN